MGLSFAGSQLILLLAYLGRISIISCECLARVSQPLSNPSHICATQAPNSSGNVHAALGNAGWTHYGPSARRDSFTVYIVFYWVVAGATGTFMLDF